MTPFRSARHTHQHLTDNHFISFLFADKPVFSSSQAVSASQLLSRPNTLPTISTLASSVDALLLPSRGVQQRNVIEIAGGPGVGKTAALIGLAIDCRRSSEIRKLDGEGGKGGDVLIIGELALARQPPTSVADRLASLTR